MQNDLEKLRREVRIMRGLLVAVVLIAVGVAWQGARAPAVRELTIVDADGKALITLGSNESGGVIRLADGDRVAELTAQNLALTDGKRAALVEPTRLGLLDGKNGISIKTRADGESDNSLTIVQGERQTSIGAARIDAIGPNSHAALTDDRVAVVRGEALAAMLLKENGGAVATRNGGGKVTWHSSGH